jgi:hypothetical protein
MKETVNNKICAYCNKKFVGCACNRTMSSNKRVVHKKCKEKYEVKLKNEENTKKDS